uniref:ATP-binding protein n=1 Tax=Streptomyces sp. NBC_00003 TaxID=2903608 RepID=A0AAU2V7S6_9ACTN
MTARRARVATAASPEAVTFVRKQVLTQVDAWGLALEKDTWEAIRLVTSELVTNAVVHAGGMITIGLYLNDSTLLLVVHDGSQALPARPDPPRAEEPESGRGLLLVEAFAARWGWDPTPEGKEVWAEFEVSPPGMAAEAELVRCRAKAARPHPRLRILPQGVVLAGALR